MHNKADLASTRITLTYGSQMRRYQKVLTAVFSLKHLHNVETRYYCPQAFLHLDCQCGLNHNRRFGIEKSCMFAKLIRKLYRQKLLIFATRLLSKALCG